MRICKDCGNDFLGGYSTKICPICIVKTEKAICHHCKKEFDKDVYYEKGNKKNQKYCSPSCKIGFNNKKHPLWEKRFLSVFRCLPANDNELKQFIKNYNKYG